MDDYKKHMRTNEGFNSYLYAGKLSNQYVRSTFARDLFKKSGKKIQPVKRIFLNYENLFWLILYPNLKSLGLYNVFERKIIITTKMDTPKIPGKIGKHQVSVFFKSSWVAFYLFFLYRQVWKLFKNRYFFLKFCLHKKRDQWSKDYNCGPIAGEQI